MGASSLRPRPWVVQFISSALCQVNGDPATVWFSFCFPSRTPKNRGTRKKRHHSTWLFLVGQRFLGFLVAGGRPAIRRGVQALHRHAAGPLAPLPGSPRPEGLMEALFWERVESYNLTCSLPPKSPHPIKHGYNTSRLTDRARLAWAGIDFKPYGPSPLNMVCPLWHMPTLTIRSRCHTEDRDGSPHLEHGRRRRG